MVVIDTTIAQAFLERAAEQHNRRQRKTNVNTFTRLIEGNKFDNTHQGIAFNVNGELTDGQHRMKALVILGETNPEIKIVVDITYNMPVDAAYAYDGGARRSNVDHATVGGVDHAAVVTRLVRLLHQVRETQGRSANFKDVRTLQPAEIVDLAKEFGGDLFDAWEAIQPLRKVTGLNRNAAAVFYYLALEASPDAPVDEFVKGLAEMEWSYANDPRRVLHRWAANSPNNKRVDVRHHLAHLIMTFNDFCQGEPRQANKWLPTWGIPSINVPAPDTPRRKAVQKKTDSVPRGAVGRRASRPAR